MSSISTAKPASSTSTRVLPLLICFDQEPQVWRLLAEIPRYRRVSFHGASELSSDIERILISGNETLVAEHYDELRRPNIRLVALSDHRFQDPRIDGLVYTYLPTGTPYALLERTIDNALDHIHLIHVREEINERLRDVTREIQELNKIGAALSAEHRLDKLLELIMTKSREITSADAGSLYLVEAVPVESAAAIQPSGVAASLNGNGGLPAAQLLKNDVEEPAKKRLRFRLAQNDSIDVPFRESTMEIDHRSIAGYVADTGKIVNIDDAYHLPLDLPYQINRKFDEDSGYRTRSILAVPLRDQKDQIVGVLQLINAKRDRKARLHSLEAMDEQVIPFGSRQQDVVASLASQAAVAVENSRLYENIHRLFEGFVRASVIAIEARDPTTSGHSFRVANLTVALAEAVQRIETGPYAKLRFTREEMREIRYASLLHDFGKVGVREEVLVKAKKLYPAQLELVKQRFDFVKRSMQAEQLQKRLDYVLAKGRDEYMRSVGRFDEDLRNQLIEVDHFFETVLKADEPTVLPEGSFERLADIAARYYHDFEGREQPLLMPDEVRLLSIRKGSLDDNERQQIESHVVHTFNFLQQIPWTSEIRHIPDIARGHHEKLNGLGYPYKLSAPEIPVQTRMMTISDIFDALSASDRPYKHSVSLDHALGILHQAVEDGEIDASLFQLFVEAKVYERWKIEPHPY
jgi:HD-GYP domain-containing protein (c-di-GMP phosphodiesterase class II)